MAATFSLAWEVSGNAGGKAFKAGNLNAPAQYSTSSDIASYARVTVPAGESTRVTIIGGSAVEVASATMILLVPSVDGSFSWTSATQGTNNGSLLGWKAGMPLFFPTGQALMYNATATTMVAGTLEDLFRVYFYNPGTSDGYVEVMLVK